MTAPNPNNDPTGFFGLPAELRNDIYRQVLESEQHANLQDLSRRVVDGVLRPHGRRAVVWLLVAAQQPDDPALMQANRQMRQEVGDMFLGTRNMRLTTSMRNLPVAVGYLRRIRVDIGRSAPFASLTINLLDASWQSLQHMLPLIDFLRTMDFDGDIALLSRGARPGARRLNLASSLQRAVDLGMRARREGWNEVRMRQEVDRWADGQRQTTAGLAAALAARLQQLTRPKKPWYEGKRKR